MYSENTYRNTMIASVNCLILGEASDNNFNVVVGEVYTNDDKIDVVFDQFIVSNFKELLFHEIKDLGVKMEPEIEFKEYFDNDKKKPKRRCLHIFIVPAIVAPTTDLERKRRAVQDVGGEVLRRLIKRPRLTIPEIGSLSEFLDRELPEDIKIPISQNEIDMLQSKNVTDLCSLDDLRVLFRKPFGTSHSRRGEGKSSTSTEDPKSELGRKLVWTYDPAPYVLGYYTHGPQVTLVAICRPVEGYALPDVVDIVQSNLKFRSERVRHLLRIINLSCIINALQPVIGRRGIPEFRSVYRNGRMIEIRGTGVKKTYLFENIQTRVQKLVNLYEKLVRKEVPNIDHLDCYNKESGSVHLSPKGLQVVPSNQQELFEAITCVLEAIVVLHDGNDPIYHRDIRWDNIIRRYDDPSKWFLIDWDDATEYPSRPAMHLTTEEHAPEVFTRNHRDEVDIWSVGKLIKNASTWITNLSEKITEFGDLLLSQDSTKRPSAKEALKKFKKIKKFLKSKRDKIDISQN
ncbi:crinkler (CRN) family protein [Rhizophagus clarus]|uniref:Crinkler (CRN) family protein n=1 Tax=Rhizophagus clarus TaxID=94130 RepID=A0A8H3LBK4_9GLOM|nr:crinkler (CRN) family protein [Rhizophagus clarus]